MALKSISTIIISLLIAISEAKPLCSEDDNTERSLEAQLKTSLFCEYDTEVRPVKQHGNAINVELDIMALSIKTSEETGYGSDSVTINCASMMTWYDPYLNWSHIPKYSVIKVLTVPSYKVWVPNIIMVNTENRYSTKDWDGYCFIRADGEVICIAYTSYQLSCQTNFVRWPYDSMNCTMRFKTWLHSGEAINLTMVEYEINDEENLNELNKDQHYWRTKSMGAQYNKQVLKSLNMTFSNVNYSYILTRHTATWATLIIGPILVMISLVLISYILELNSMERLGLLSVSALCHFYFMLQINWYLPATGSTCPMIVYCVRASLIMNVMAVLQTLVLRFLKECTSNSVDSLLGLLEKATGKMFTFRGFQKMDSTHTSDDTNNAVKVKWELFTLFLNRVFLTITTLTYFITFLVTITL